VVAIAALSRLADSNRYDTRDIELKRSYAVENQIIDMPSKLGLKKLSIQMDDALNRANDAENKLAAKAKEFSSKEMDYACQLAEKDRMIITLEAQLSTNVSYEIIRRLDDALNMATNAKANLAQKVDEHATREADFARKLAEAERRIKELELAMVAKLKELATIEADFTRKIADAERRVKIAEAKSASDSASNNGSRLGVLRRALAKNFHPDSLHCSAIERAVRTEIFKELWEIIDGIESVNNGPRK
jgi:hypothetical protein